MERIKKCVGVSKNKLTELFRNCKHKLIFCSSKTFDIENQDIDTNNKIKIKPRLVIPKSKILNIDQNRK